MKKIRAWTECVTLLGRSIERGCVTATDECVVFPVVSVAAVAGD